MADLDTAIGGTGRSFPTTIWSQILSAGNPDDPANRERLDALLRTYWKPVFAYIRSSWRKSVEDAKDLTQAFFAYVLQKDYLAKMAPDRGSFRGYLKRALKHFLIDAERRDTVRRAVQPGLAVEADPAELQKIATAEDPERAYDREWFRLLLTSSIDELKRSLEAEGKKAYFEVFRIYCLDAASAAGDADEAGPTYGEVAKKLGLQESDVRNYLTHGRGALRQILRRRIREYVAADGDVDVELQEVLKG